MPPSAYTIRRQNLGLRVEKIGKVLKRTGAEPYTEQKLDEVHKALIEAVNDLEQLKSEFPKKI